MSEDTPRLFEALDGSSPGTQPKSEDITGVPLAPENGKGDWDDSFAQTGSNMPVVPGGDPYGGGDQPGDGPVEDFEPQPQKRKNRSARDRISQLTSRYRQEQNDNQDLREELKHYQEKVDALERSRYQPRQAATPPTEESYSDYTQNPADIAQIVEQNVRRAVAPLAEKLAATERMSALREEQQQSIASAIREIPELNDVASEEAQAFQEIWARSPLRNDPNGPYQVALMVKGAFAEERQTRPAREARKRAAGIVTTGPREVNENTPTPRGRAMKGIIDEGFRRMQGGDASAENYIAVRKAQRRQRGR